MFTGPLMFLAGEEDPEDPPDQWCLLWASRKGLAAGAASLGTLQTARDSALPVREAELICGKQNTGRCQWVFQCHMFFTGWGLLEAVQCSWGWAVLLKSVFSVPRSPHRLLHPLLKAPEALLSLMDNSFSFFPFVLSDKEKLLLFQGEEGERQGGKKGGRDGKENFLLGLGCLQPPHFQPCPTAGLDCCWYGNAPLHQPNRERWGKIIIHLHLANGVQTPRD